MRAPARVALILLAAVSAGCAPQAPPLLPVAVPVFRGHRDLDADWNPWVLGRAARVGLCLDAAAGTDTSQWEMRLFGEPAVAPAVRLDTTVCFEAPLPQAHPDGPAELCPELRDRFDGARQALPCVPFRFDAEDTALARLEAAIPAILAGDGDPVPRLDALAGEARGRGFPALVLRLNLIAVYQLRRQGATESAAKRMRDAPPWIGAPAAARWAGQHAYERATLELENPGALASSWMLLREAESRFRASGDPKWIAAAGKQAEVLSRAGALEEAKDRLRFAIEQCRAAPCDAALVHAAENTLAWLVTADPDASEEELEAAERSLTALLDTAPPEDPLEHANLALNLALASQRRGRSPEVPLQAARERIGAATSGRPRELSGWADLVEARQALASARPAEAAALGERLATSGPSPRLRAFGLSCAGAAHRLLGDLARADACYSGARAVHAYLAAGKLSQEVPLGPGQRAEDAYAAARVALERGRADDAWSLLLELDGDAPTGNTLDLEPWLAALRELEGPASGPRRAQRQAIRRAALDRMQERVRAASIPVEGTDDTGVSFRAFPADDEIVLLRRTPSGTVVTERRTPFPRARLVAAIRALEEAIERQDPDDAAWAALAAPLARALVPGPGSLGDVTTFAVHGILQQVPLAALPLPTQRERRWLGQVTTVAWHPAGVRAAPQRSRATGDALFVEDPLGDLGIASRAGSGPPGTRRLAGEAATREALRGALPSARWLHVDAHARYEPAFPDLSAILLADGPVLGQELSAWATGLELANLSGCRTGRAPVTADSGRFGMTGLLVRRGVPWAVGARAVLSNALALDFNRTFYARLSEGAAVPDAYRAALAAAGARHPASHWAVLLLLHAEEGGQSRAARTPSSPEGLR